MYVHGKILAGRMKTNDFIKWTGLPARESTGRRRERSDKDRGERAERGERERGHTSGSTRRSSTTRPSTSASAVSVP